MGIRRSLLVVIGTVACSAAALVVACGEGEDVAPATFAHAPAPGYAGGRKIADASVAVRDAKAGVDVVTDAGADAASLGDDCIRGAYGADKPIPGVPPPVCCPGLHWAWWPTIHYCPPGSWCLGGRCGDGICEPGEGDPTFPITGLGMVVCGCANDCLPDGGSTGVVLDAGPDGG
jgi:hypothetical protein